MFKKISKDQEVLVESNWSDDGFDLIDVIVFNDSGDRRAIEVEASGGAFWGVVLLPQHMVYKKLNFWKATIKVYPGDDFV